MFKKFGKAVLCAKSLGATKKQQPPQQQRQRQQQQPEKETGSFSALDSDSKSELYPGEKQQPQQQPEKELLSSSAQDSDSDSESELYPGEGNNLTQSIINKYFGEHSDPTVDIQIPERRLGILNLTTINKQLDLIRDDIDDYEINSEEVPLKLQIQLSRIKILAWQAQQALFARRQRKGKEVIPDDEIKQAEDNRLREEIRDGELKLLVELYTCQDPDKMEDIKQRLQEYEKQCPFFPLPAPPQSSQDPKAPGIKNIEDKQPPGSEEEQRELDQLTVILTDVAREVKSKLDRPGKVKRCEKHGRNYMSHRRRCKLCLRGEASIGMILTLAR